MGFQTFKKRQKEAARREKQQKKMARRLERKHENKKPVTSEGLDSPEMAGVGFGQAPTVL